MRLRSTTVILALGIMTLALAITAAVVSARRDAEPLDTSSTTGVVRAYVRAIVDGDAVRAAGLLDPALGCHSHLPDHLAPTSVVMTVVSANTRGDTARVVLDIDEGGQALRSEAAPEGPSPAGPRPLTWAGTR